MCWDYLNKKVVVFLHDHFFIISQEYRVCKEGFYIFSHLYKGVVSFFEDLSIEIGV